MQRKHSFLVGLVALVAAAAVSYPLIYSADASSALDGEWLLTSRTDGNGDPAMPPDGISMSYTFDTTTDEMTVSTFADDELVNEFDVPFTELGSGQLQFTEASPARSVTIATSISGDVMTITTVSESNISEPGKVPPYEAGTSAPSAGAPTPGAPQQLVLTRVP